MIARRASVGLRFAIVGSRTPIEKLFLASVGDGPDPSTKAEARDRMFHDGMDPYIHNFPEAVETVLPDDTFFGYSVRRPSLHLGMGCEPLGDRLAPIAGP